MPVRFVEANTRGALLPSRLGGLAAVLLLLVGCATGTPVGLKLEGRGLRYRPAVPYPFVRETRRAPVATVDVSKRGVLPAGTAPSGTGGLAGYKAFIQRARKALPQRPEAERPLEEAVLRELEWWLWQQDAAALERRHPVEVYLRLKEARQAAERREAAHQARVEEKLEEYWRWAEALSRHQARQHFRPVGRAHLLTESPLWEAAQYDVVSATLGWAYRHTGDVDFLSKSPSEVALYLLATRSALAQALVAGSVASPQVDSAPVRDKTLEEEEADEERELLVGLLPVVGDIVDFGAALSGYSVTGRRKLEEGERLLCAVGVLLPVLHGKALGNGAEALERLALATGRGLDEVRVMVRIAEHLSPEEARRLEGLVRSASRTGRLTEEEWAFLQRTARHLEAPLNAWREALQRGEKVPFLHVRKDADGLRLVPGSDAHLAQAWVEYQFRNPGTYPRFRYAPDERWRRMYRTVLENKGKGSAFEQEVLQKLGHEKNTALLLPPPGSKAQGFVPDAVPGNPHPGELVWGQPYRFVEAKSRAELSLGGNLKAMLDYIDAHGGHIELWVRSSQHPEGPTRLTQPLQLRLTVLRRRGQASIKPYP